MTKEMNIPQAGQFERTVLGAILLDPSCLPEVVGILSPEDFYDTMNGEVYGVIRSMYDASEDIDLYTVSRKCKKELGAFSNSMTATLSGYTLLVGSASNVSAHAMAVKEKSMARRSILVANSVLSKIYSGEDISEVMDNFNTEMDGLTLGISGGKSARHLKDILSDSLRNAEQRQIMAQQGKAPGVPTGLTRLDEVTAGWQPSELIVLAARPGMGKTAFMLHSAKEAAKAGYPACIYSLEMSDTSLGDRLLLSECDINADVYKMGKMDPQDWKNIEATVEDLSKLPLYIDDNPVVSMRYIRTHSKLMKKRGQCGIIFIDYLQLADTASDRKNRNREQEIAQASREAKIIAKDLNVPVVLLSQLSRKCEERSGRNKMPILSDLRESGAIEQDADVVGFIFRPAYCGIQTWETTIGEVDTHEFGILNIAKNRNGATDEVAFRHNYSMTKITDYKTYDNEPKRGLPF